MMKKVSPVIFCHFSKISGVIVQKVQKKSKASFSYCNLEGIVVRAIRHHHRKFSFFPVMYMLVFAKQFGIDEETQKRWKSLNPLLRPLDSASYAYRTVEVDECQCSRETKVLKSSDTSGIMLNETTCSLHAYARGT